ncbi:hypothetical protein Tco_1309571, partial [Tanacetum coccineum]
FLRRPTAKGVGLRVADSHTGNHPEDDFMPLETIRSLYSIFGRRSHLGFEGETFEPKGRVRHQKLSDKEVLWSRRASKEAIEEGLGIIIILVSPEENMYSYAIRLKFKASNYAMDCEALLAGLAASANQGMKDLHVFIDSLTLVA